MKIKIHKGFWTRDQVARDVESVYVFGDNVDDYLNHYVPSSTQAVIRSLPNSCGIWTKKDRKWNDSSFFSDNDYSYFSEHLDTVIEMLYSYSDTGMTITFPSDGIGTGKAMLEEKAPLCWEYLCKRLKEEFNYNNGQDN